MKFRSRLFLKDHYDETRIVRKFLWWPRCFNGKHWRLLEFANIRERVINEYYLQDVDKGVYIYKWVEVGFDD